MSNSAFAPVLYPQLEPDAEPGTSSANARGYAAGYAEGMRRAAREHAVSEDLRQAELAAFVADSEARVARAANALSAAVAQLNARLVPAIREADDVLIEASLDLAESVLQREVTTGHVTSADVLRRALALVPDDQIVTVRLNPVDAQTLGAVDSGTVSVASDATVAPGDAITTMPQGWLDARLFAALERARSALVGEQP
jgi:flagellar assembly protein FliH